MEINFSPKKLITLRKLKGFSQDKLAEKAGINIRTLQRIERNEVKPQLYTLGCLSDSLGVSIEDLYNTDVKSVSEEKSPQQLSLLHFSAMAGCVFPLANIIVPYSIWVYNKNATERWNKHLRKVINFQLSWLLYLIIILILYFVIEAFAFLVFLLPLIALFSIIICPAISGILILKSKANFYPLTINFI